MYRIGSTELTASPLGFGCWPLSGHGLGSVPPEREILKTLEEAARRGFNLFDTAPVYGLGRSEELLGKVFGRRGPLKNHPVTIASKCGLSWDARGRVVHDNSASTIRLEVEASLKRLQRETIDLYQVHWPDPKTPLAETLAALERLKLEGKIREIGLCNFGLPELKEAKPLGSFVSLQSEYSLIERQVETTTLPWCQSQEITTLVYKPLAHGLLTGKYADLPPRFGKRDVRSRDANFQNPRFATIRRAVGELGNIAKTLQVSTTALTLAWLLHQPLVDIALVGIKNRKQLKDPLKAMALKLEQPILDKIAQLFAFATASTWQLKSEETSNPQPSTALTQ